MNTERVNVTSDYLESQGLSETFPARFWKKVNKTDGCWNWTASIVNWGYGNIGMGVPPHLDNLRASAHRGYSISDQSLKACASFIIAITRPVLLQIICSLAPTRVNTQDAISKGRLATGERHGCRKPTWEIVAECRRLYSKLQSGCINSPSVMESPPPVCEKPLPESLETTQTPERTGKAVSGLRRVRVGVSL